MVKKFTSTVAGASIYISVLLIISKGLGFFREIIYAGYFGISDIFDLYLVSTVFPITLNIIIYFLGQNYFIPTFNRVVQSSENDGDIFFTQAMILFILGGVLLALGFFIFSNSIFQYLIIIENTENIEKANNIFKIILVTIPLSAGISILTSFLQVKLEFKYPAVSHLFLNSSIIILILVFSSSLGIYVLPIGYVIGTMLQFIYLLYKVKKINDLSFFHFLLDKKFLITPFQSSLLLIVIIESTGQLYMIVDRFFYKSVDAGGIAALNYAQNLYHFPLSIFAFALSTAIFPKLSKAFQKKTFSELTNIVIESLRICIVIFLPISLLFIFFGDSIISLIYERGQFTNEGSKVTFSAFRLLSLSLVFYAIYSILNKIFYSTELIKPLLLITVIGIFLKIFFSFLLVDEFSQNGLALSTTISYFAFFVMSFIYLNFKLKLSYFKKFLSELFIISSNGLISLMLVFTFYNIFGKVNNSIHLLLILLFCIFYSLNLYIIKHPAIKNMVKMLEHFSSRKVINT
jgi:putative peptidoglycan lipid II flippase